MRKLCHLGTLMLGLLLLASTTRAQDFSNKGKEFWLAYCYHVGMTGGTPPEMTLYITSDVTTTYTVEIFGVTTLQTGTINAGQVITMLVPSTYFINGEGTYNNKTIRVTAAKPVVVYSYITRSAASGATLCLPTPVLGREYFSANFTQVSNESNSNSYFTIIAVENNTTVEITPSANTTGGWIAGNTYTVPLNQGQIYQVLGTTTGNSGVDLSGSRIRSISAGGTGCKRIAVFSGSGKIRIPATGCSQNSSDNLYQQLYPVASWGKKYLTVPSYNRTNNYFRIFRSSASANVTLNGTLIPPGSFTNNYYQFMNNTPNRIESNEPISVFQYFTTQGCDGNVTPYDPDMIALNPVEQNINRVTLVSSNLYATPTSQHQHHIHVIIPNGGTAMSSFRIDGNPVPAGNWQTHPNDANYRYLYLNNVTQGYHTISSDSGFNALAYGYANAETYGYSAGANVKDLFQFVTIQNQYATVNFPATCIHTPFYFTMTFPYQPTSITWDFNGLFPNFNMPDPTVYFIGTVVVGGKTLYQYRIPTPYTIAAPGTYPIKVTATNPTPDGCGGLQEITYDLQVFEQPQANFDFTNVCFPNPVQFSDNSNTGGRPIISRYWDFGDLTNSNQSAPLHAYPAAGSYNARYAIITDVGCVSDTTTRVVVVSAPPTASITGDINVCKDAPQPQITFTGAGGVAPYTFTYNINGGPSQQITTSSGSSVTLSVPTGTPGSFTYNLTYVADGSPAACGQNQTASVVVNVSPLPTANISGNTTVCLNAPTPDITFTGANATAPYTFTYNINGGPNQQVTTTSGNSVTVPVPTNVAGTYTYNLVSVQEGSAQLCNQAQTGSVTVTVNPLPTASITGTTTVCLNAPQPQVTFTGGSGTPPYTFTYNINGGANQTISTTSGNTVTLNVPTNTAGTYTYNLVSVQEGSAQLCSQAQNGSAIVNVSPLPTATIAGNTTVCLNAPSPDITFTGASGTAPFTFTYNINGGPNQTVTTTSGNSVTVAVPTGTAGTYTYNLVSVQEGSAQACSQAQTGSAVVIVNPLPTATIAGTIAVCQNAASPDIIFTGAIGTAPYTFTYNINGGPNQAVTTTSGNSVTVSVPTATPGTFTYNLVSVQEGSAQLCSQAQTGSATVTVNPLPTATITGSTEVCRNATSPNITFTGSAGTAPYTFTYNINGGGNQTVTTTSGNSVTVAVPTATAGTFTYNLVSVQDATATLCSQAQTGSATVIVNPLPTSQFTSSAPLCETGLVSFTDISTPNVGSIISWQWDFGDPASGANNTSTLQNPSHVYAAAGTYNVLLVVTTDKGCVSIQPAQPLTINARPRAGFIIPEVCLSDTYAQFTDTSSVDAPATIVGWQWNFGDPGSGANNTSTLQNPQHSYTATGNYNVELIVTTNHGCKDTIQHVLTVNGSFPVADFIVQNPTTLCANDSVAIAEASTVFPGSITKVEIYWDNVGQPAAFDTDNSPFPGKIYRHLYPNFQAPLTRTFTIRYRAYSGGVCVNDKLRTITVNAAPRVQFTAMPDVCYDAAPFQITQASETGGVPGSGTYSGPGVSPTGIFNPASVGPGTYTIKYKYTSTTGGCSDSLSQTILVLDTATARFTYQALVCERSPISFNSTTSTIPPSAGTITGWQWNFGDPASGAANTSTLQNPTHTFSNWGTYTVSLYVTTSLGCRSTIYSTQVFVNPLPRPNFTYPASACLPSANVQFTNTSTIPDGTQASFNFLWNFGDPGSGTNNSSTGSSPSHIYNAVGPFNVNLQVTSGVGCVRDTTIVVNNIHPQPTGNFNVDKTDVCVGQSFRFTDISNPADGTTTTWNWDMGDGNVRSTPTFSYNYGTAGTYNVTLSIVNSFGCRSTSFSRQLTVNPYPVVNAGPDLFILEGGSDTIKAVVTAINPSYLWTPNQFFVTSNTVLQPIVNGVDDITYTLTVTGRGDCRASDQVFIKVLKGPEIPNIFSPNGDGVHDTWIIKYLDTYPGCTVEVFNRYGQRIFSSVGYGQPWDGTVNGKPVPMGTYYYIVNPKNGRKIMSGYVDVIR